MHGKPLMVFNFEPLGAVRGDRRDFCGEGRVFAGIGSRALACLQEAGVDRLRASLRINLLSTFALQDDRRNAHRAVPRSEVRDSASGRQRENIGALLNFVGMVLEDLGDENACVLSVDDDVDAHLLE